MSAINDPRKYLKDILTPMAMVAITKDNDVTPANVIVLYEGGPESLRHLFYVNNYDAVVMIMRHRERESGPEKRIQWVPLRYTGEVPIHTVAIDRTGVTATKILNKIRRQIIAYVETMSKGPFPWASRATIVPLSTGEINKIEGGFDPLWCDEIMVQFRPYTEEG